MSDVQWLEHHAGSLYRQASDRYRPRGEPQGDLGEPAGRPVRALDADFLRWMLSDGAGAMFLSAVKRKDGLSLKVGWVELVSYAGVLEICICGGGMKRADGRWFSNLAEKGNTGSAAIFIILEELFHSGRLQPGQNLLGFIPESGRFSHGFAWLTLEA